MNMSELKYKVGDKVRIKSLDWYNENKDINGNIRYKHGNVYPIFFTKYMSRFCGETVTIKCVHTRSYHMKETGSCEFWTDEMIECKVESVEDRMKELRKMCTISLTDSNYSDKVEVLLNDYEYIEEDGKAFFVKKKKEYPKTYEECSLINSCEDRIPLKIIGEFTRLVNARNAYWKLYGEEMGLGKPWKPNWTSFEGYPAIYMYRYQITLSVAKNEHHFLVFPSEEMRNQFYENFKELINECKELL